MCTVLLPPGVKPIAVNKYVYKYLSIIEGHPCFFLTFFISQTLASTLHQNKSFIMDHENAILFS